MNAKKWTIIGYSYKALCLWCHGIISNPGKVQRCRHCDMPLCSHTCRSKHEAECC